MFNAISRRARRLAAPVFGASAPGRDSAQAHNATVRLQIPNPYGGMPWLTATVALSSVPSGYGETLRVRAHLDGCLQRPHGANQRAVLAHAPAGERSLTQQGRRAAASVVRSVCDRLPVERLGALTGRRWRSWLDLQLSTAPLDGGAEALMPESLRTLCAGGLPTGGAGQPRIGVWAGPAGGPAGGLARVAMLQLDEAGRKHGRNGKGGGVNLNLYIAEVVDPLARDGS